MIRKLLHNLPSFFLALALAIAVWLTAVSANDPDVTQPYPNPIPIEFVGQDSKMVLTGTVTEQVQLTLRAPTSIWDEFNSGEATIRAVADLTGLEAGTHSVNVQIQIAARPVRIISVTPKSLELSLEPLVTKTLPVEVTLTGEPAIGYKAGDLSLDPTSITISGPESLVAQAKFLRATLDVTNARQDIDATRPISIIAEDGSALTGITLVPSSVEVQLPLIQQGGYRDLAVRVVSTGQPASGYRLNNVSTSPAIVTVYSENIPLIESLPGYVDTLPLNLAGASENIQTDLALNLPGGVTLIGDQTVTVLAEVVPIEGSLTKYFQPVKVKGLAAGLQYQLSPSTVDVILSGPIPTLETLVDADLRVELDLSGLGSGTYQLIPIVSADKQGVTVQSILPGTVQVILSSRGTATP